MQTMQESQLKQNTLRFFNSFRPVYCNTGLSLDPPVLSCLTNNEFINIRQNATFTQIKKREMI